MSGDDQLRPPPAVWAQEASNIVFTVNLEDCKKPVVEIHEDKIYFKGTGGLEKKAYEVTVNLYKEINPDESSCNVRGRNVEYVLKKKESGPFWPRLTKEKVKYHWLKLDFHKFNYEQTNESENDALSVDEFIDKRFQDQEVTSLDEISKLLESTYDSDDSDLPDLE